MSRLLLEDHPRLAELIRTALNRAGIECNRVSNLAQAHGWQWAAANRKPGAEFSVQFSFALS
jgi:DNA-binding response OmpR family regulator